MHLLHAEERTGSGRFRIAAWVCVFAACGVAANWPIGSGYRYEAIRIKGPQGKECCGSVWTPPDAKAVILIGHGVTSNQGIMALLANAFVRNKYVAVTIDYWGHGRSRERFDWASNAAQLNAWCDWAQARFKGLPLAYLGHSMGGVAGDEAFREKAGVNAFVSLGMLPRHAPACKTLIAMGKFEELFSPEQARNAAGSSMEVLVSPFSDHTTEPADPTLVRGIIQWVNKALGFDSTEEAVFPYGRWVLGLLTTLVGGAAALVLAECVSGIARPSAQTCAMPAPGRFNVFRMAGRALNCTGDAAPPRSCGLASAMVRGVAFGVVLAALMPVLLNMNVYTCSLNHPPRLAMWLILSVVMTPLFLFTSRALERFCLATTFKRFAVGALTRAVPLFLVCLALELAGPGIAFLGMMFGILGFVFVFISGVYAFATRAAGDFRSGAVASGVVLAWITAFWFPLVWVP